LIYPPKLLPEGKVERLTQYLQPPTDPSERLAELATDGWSLWGMEPFGYTIKLVVVRTVKA
jgi:hypothetical protein